MNDEEIQERARDHVRQWYKATQPATMDTMIHALLLIIAAMAEASPRRETRNEFLGFMRNFIDDLQSGRVILKDRGGLQ